MIGLTGLPNTGRGEIVRSLKNVNIIYLSEPICHEVLRYADWDNKDLIHTVKENITIPIKYGKQGLTTEELINEICLEYKIHMSRDLYLKILHDKVLLDSVKTTVIIPDCNYPEDIEFITSNNGIVINVDTINSEDKPEWYKYAEKYNIERDKPQTSFIDKLINSAKSKSSSFNNMSANSSMSFSNNEPFTEDDVNSSLSSPISINSFYENFKFAPMVKLHGVPKKLKQIPYYKWATIGNKNISYNATSIDDCINYIEKHINDNQV